MAWRLNACSHFSRNNIRASSQRRSTPVVRLLISNSICFRCLFIITKKPVYVAVRYQYDIEIRMFQCSWGYNQPRADPSSFSFSPFFYFNGLNSGSFWHYVLSLAREPHFLSAFTFIYLSTCQCQTSRWQKFRMNANSMRRPTIPHIALSASAIVKDISGNALPPYETVYWFDKLIDHTNPELGTFKQRYWHTWEYYKPGSWNSRPFEWIFVNSLSWTGGPIILTTPGESNAESNLISDVSNIHLTGYITGSTSFLTNQTMSGKIAEQQNGATIVLEHRFFGLSNPYPDLSVKSLQVLTIQQAIDDLVYFAETVKLEMPGGDQVSPEKAPWVLVGGSYSGLAIQLNTISFPPLTDPSNRCPHNLDDVQVSATRIESMCPILMKTESTVQQTRHFLGRLFFFRSGSTDHVQFYQSVTLQH